ncbi:TAXI family TRAP transporter solute-binding subunit [Sabulicella rubraurantiaca]|uniref:TAXI family TRAP transporter solute-binding subunit n=1 Tax=Sabulicella rubraurantiaca TaxID=2811429 RepID=UPI001A97CFF7|nr:TAXI family TRAP transporter solute-binding subunit [Sabulicella rubraurantiaca]
MKPRRFWIAAPIVAAGLACGASPARSAEPHWPRALLIATASPGGTYHAYGIGLARILTRELGVAVSIRETDGPSENIRLIENGIAQIGFVTKGAALEGWTGSGEWTGGRQLRAIRAMFAMYDTPFHFVVRQDSGVAQISALEGKRVGVGPEGGTAATYVPRLLPRLGVQARFVHGTWADLATALRSREVDGLAVAAGAPFPAIAELEAQRAIRYLPLTRDMVATLRIAVPELAASVIPPGTYPSLNSSYETVGIYNLAVAQRDLPADLVYQIVRLVFDFHAEMVEAHPAAVATVPANFVHNTLLPWHPGAARYYENRAVRGILRGD